MTYAHKKYLYRFLFFVIKPWGVTYSLINEKRKWGYNMEIKNETKFKRTSSFAEASAESSVDYTLPDYLGDVRRILFTECEARAASHFSTEDREELSGIVVYNVVYLDGENKLSSASFTSDYDTEIKGGAGLELQCVASPRISAYNVRLLGPRKFSAKAVIMTPCRIVSEDLIAAGGSAYEREDKPICATRVLKIHSSLASERTEREYAEVVERLEGAIADEVRVVYSSADIVFDGVTAADGEAVARGNLILSAVISNADEPIYIVEKRIPIEEKVPFAEINPDMTFIPEGSVVSLTSNVNADETGAEVVLSAVVEYAVVGEYNEKVSVTTDAYLKSGPTENVYSDYCYSELVSGCAVSESVCATVAREELAGEGLREIVYAVAVPKIESVSAEDGRVAVRGEMKFSGVGSLCEEDGRISYTGVKLNAPFEVYVKCPCESGASVASAFCACSARFIIDGESVEACANLSGNISVTKNGQEKILVCCDAVSDIEYVQTSGTITVYYPDADETLFSVAKKFHTTPEKIATDNSLSEAVCAGGDTEPLGTVKRVLIY